MPFWDSLTAVVSHPSSFNPITAISHGVASASNEFVTDVENTGEFISDETKKGISEISQAARTTGKFVTNHPYETALIAGTVIVGVGLTVATGGLAGPEVAAVVGAEIGGEAVVGAAVGAEVGLGGFAAVEGAGVEALGAESGIGSELYSASANAVDNEVDKVDKVDFWLFFELRFGFWEFPDSISNCP